MRAFVRLLGRVLEKWGGMRKKVGEGAKREGDEERKGSRSGDEGVQGVKNEGSTK